MPTDIMSSSVPDSPEGTTFAVSITKDDLPINSTATDPNVTVRSSGRVNMNIYWQYRAAVHLVDYGPASIFVVGVTFNLLSLCVLLRPTMRVKSTFAYLTALVIADIIVLCSNPLPVWVENIVDNTPLVAEYSSICKIATFVQFTSSQFSSWALVVVTAERLFVIISPLRAPLVCKRSRAYAALAVLLLLFVTLNLHHFWTRELVTIWGRTICGSENKFVQDIWPWLDTCLYSLLPFSLLLAMNIAIIVQTYRAQKLRRAMSQTGAPSAAKDEHVRLTIMLLTLTFTFILLTTPISFYQIYTSVADLQHLTSKETADLIFTNKLLMNMMYLNHAINFFLYCVTGKRFRQEFLVMIRFLGVGSKASQRQTTMSSLSGMSAVMKQGEKNLSLRSLAHSTIGTVKVKEEKDQVNGGGVNPSSDREIMSAKDASQAKDGILDAGDVVLLGYKPRSDVLESRA